MQKTYIVHFENASCKVPWKFHMHSDLSCRSLFSLSLCPWYLLTFTLHPVPQSPELRADWTTFHWIRLARGALHPRSAAAAHAAAKTVALWSLAPFRLHGLTLLDSIRMMLATAKGSHWRRMVVKRSLESWELLAINNCFWSEMYIEVET